MIRIQGKLPDSFYVAVSGGPDSMGILDFLFKGFKDVRIAFFDHRTESSKRGAWELGRYQKIMGFPNSIVTIGAIERGVTKKPGQSRQEFYREERYKFFFSLGLPVITAHHLDDCVEEYIINSLKRGRSGIIPYRNRNVIRPFRLTPKRTIKQWCIDRTVPFFEDPTNKDPTYLRNYIRWHLLPEIRHNVNPGISKVVKKMIMRENKDVQRTKFLRIEAPIPT
jgi:tRNA(Ile)-lysidine synthase